MQTIKIGKSVVTVSVILLLLFTNFTVQAQLWEEEKKDPAPRSIWDKEPASKTDGSPFGSLSTAQQRLGSGLNQQTTTLGGPGGTGLQGGTSGPDAGGVPIDGGLGLLLAAGAGYGVKRIRKVWGKRKSQK